MLASSVKSRHDLGVSREGEDLPDAMDVLEQKRHMISFAGEPDFYQVGDALFEKYGSAPW
jgi:hypothetical protein